MTSVVERKATLIDKDFTHPVSRSQMSAVIKQMMAYIH